jgi:hypothetical protein
MRFFGSHRRENIRVQAARSRGSESAPGRGHRIPRRISSSGLAVSGSKDAGGTGIAKTPASEVGTCVNGPGCGSLLMIGSPRFMA